MSFLENLVNEELFTSRRTKETEQILIIWLYRENAVLALVPLGQSSRIRA